jgi:glycosyltransferase involved in cell wall biosynthesis
VIIEAMAAGVPVVASRVGGMPDLLVDGANALLVEPGDGDGLTAAIDRLFTDSALAERLSAAGRAFATVNTLEVHRGRILEPLAAAVASTSKPMAGAPRAAAGRGPA